MRFSLWWHMVGMCQNSVLGTYSMNTLSVLDGASTFANTYKSLSFEVFNLKGKVSLNANND